MSFSAIAGAASKMAGHPLAFLGAATMILLWALSGPLFGYSDTWQLVVNTATTVVTFLMVFLLQNSQNRDGEALQRKVDELLRAQPQADDRMIGIEKRRD